MQSPPQADKNQRWQVAGICCFLVAAVLLLFGRTFQYGFVNLDDDLIVYDNPHVLQGLGWDGIVWAFTHFDSYFYTPLTTISHMLDCQLFGPQFDGYAPANAAGGHHLVNVLLHAGATALLFLALRQMTGALWRSALVAVIFAIHPLHVESVAWVSERKDVLSGLFFMLTLMAYARYVRLAGTGGALRGVLRYFIVVAAFILCLLSKPVGVTLPFLLLLLDYWPLQRLQAARKKGGMPGTLWLVLEKLPLLALSVAASMLAVRAEAEAVRPVSEYPISARLANAVVSCMTYILQMFYPTKMTAFYPHPGSSLEVWQIAMSALGLLFVTVVVLILRGRFRYLPVGWFWYLGMLVPMSQLVQVGAFARADRFTYLSQIGLYIMGAWVLADLSAKWARQREMAGTIAGLLIAELMVIAWVQVSYWENSVTLWTHAIACNPGNALAHNNLGEVLIGKGDAAGAGAEFQEAISINPRYAEAHSNLAAVLYRQKNVEEAQLHLEKALEIKPRIPAARNLLGNVLSAKGETKEAIAQYEKALEIRPHYTSASSNLAWVLATNPLGSFRDGARAVELARDANKSSGGKNPKILRVLAAAYAEAGRFPEAVETAQQAMQVAGSNGLAAFAKQIGTEIKLYEARTPLREGGDAP